MKISIIIPTLGRKSLYPLIKNLKKQEFSYDYEIILIPQVKIDEKKVIDVKTKIIYCPKDQGFAYYRNIGISKSKGDIIVFIDDDEIPMNTSWLSKITQPILKGKEQVVSSGVKILLGQGYLADSISLLGFPGGGALGYEVIWPLKNGSYTDRVCTGNMAITRKLLSKVGNFTEKMKYGSEDMDLGKKIMKLGINIKYLKDVTVYHEARKDYVTFIRWNYTRGKSAASHLSLKEFLKRFLNSKKAIDIIRKKYLSYLPGAIWVIIVKHIAQTAGFASWKIKSLI